MPNRLDYNFGLVTIRSSALENSHVLATPTTANLGGFGPPFDLLALEAVNYDTSTGYQILLFDATTLPSNGAVAPVWVGFVATASSTVPVYQTLSWVNAPLKFVNGIVVAGSTALTTPFTLTVGTNSLLFFSAQVTA